MKQYSLFLFSFLVSIINVSAQNWDTSISGQITYSGSKVGIGTSSPNQILHVEKSGNTFIRLENTSTYGSTLLLGAVSSNGKVESQLQFEQELGFYDHSQGKWRFAIKPDGKVGIGTLTPTEKLQVNGHIRLNNYSIKSAGNSRIDFGDVGLGNESDDIGIYIHNDGEFELNRNGVRLLNLTNHVNIATESSTKVGIGTTSPTEKLHVEGGTSIIADIGVPVNPYWKTGSHTLELQNNDGGEVILSFHRAGYNSASIKSPIDGGLVLSGRGSSAYEDVYIDRNSRVGIGTTSPDEKLTVKGTIHSEEVKVDLSVPGPDYVFEVDYNLRSLEETEAYIKTNKHLPEIPSAKEMEANGVQLGEMNMLLLKKIEELTLHVIDLKKNQDAILKENAELKEKLNNNTSK